MIRCIVLASEDITANYRRAPGAQEQLSSLSDFSQFCDIKLLINPPPSSPSNAAAMGVNIDLHCAGFSPAQKRQNPYLHLLPHPNAERASSARLPVVNPPHHHPPFLPSWEWNAGKDKTTSKDVQM